MKKFLHFAALLLSVALARADLVVEQKMESSFLNGAMTMKIKGDRARIDMPSPAGAVVVIMDIHSGQMTTLLSAQKMMMKMSLDQVKAAAEAQQKANGLDLTKIAPKDTGAKEKVGTWDCAIYTIDMGNGMTAKMWVAKDYPNYQSIMAQMNKLSAAFSAGMGIDLSKFDMGGMTVKSEVNTQLGKVVSTLVSAKEDAVADTEFDIPTGYTEMPMPGNK